MRLLNVIIASALLFLVGCASAPMASSDLDQKAKSFENSSDKATLYIYRNENFGAAISMEVLVNNKSIGQTAAKTYFGPSHKIRQPSPQYFGNTPPQNRQG